jgi:hypothetical protein
MEERLAEGWGAELERWFRQVSRHRPWLMRSSLNTGDLG